MSINYTESSTVSVREVAAILGCCDETVRRNAWKPEFPIRPVRVGRRIRFPKSLVDRFIDGVA